MEFTLEELYTKRKDRLMTVRAQEKTRRDCPIILLHLPMQTAVHLLSALKMILQSQELTTTTTMSMIYLEYP